MLHDTVCPRCGAKLHDREAAWLSGPPGYAPALFWVHDRPDGKGKCRLHSGPRLGGYADAGSGGSIDAATLSAAHAAPDRHD
jgi:hypothetical protein